MLLPLEGSFFLQGTDFNIAFALYRIVLSALTQYVVNAVRLRRAVMREAKAHFGSNKFP